MAVTLWVHMGKMLFIPSFQSGLKNLFLPSFQSTHLVVDSMKPYYHEPWNSWRQISYNIKEKIWNQFRTKCTWQPQHQNEINDILEKKAVKRIKDTMFAARNTE
nr:uncharacterized protein LOC117274570 [Nicotiana tomentosiformis]